MGATLPATKGCRLPVSLLYFSPSTLTPIGVLPAPCLSMAMQVGSLTHRLKGEGQQRRAGGEGRGLRG